MKRTAAAMMAAICLMVGCGGSDDEPRRDVVPGRFAGNDGAGIGVAVDFPGFDPTKLAIRRAETRDGRGAPEIAIVSLVNRTTSLTEIPQLTAVLRNGERVLLRRATRFEHDGRVVPLPNLGPYIPVEGATTVYVLYSGAVDAIEAVEMQLPGDDPVRLEGEPVPL